MSGRIVMAFFLLVATLATTLVAQTDPAHQQFLFAYKLLQRGENQLAVEAFDDYLNQFKQAPKRGDALYFSAMLHRRLGNRELALERLENVPQPQMIDTDAVELLRGQLLVDLGKFEQAIKPLERIDISDQPDVLVVSVLYLKGMAYRGAGNLDAAAEMLRQAAQRQTPMQSQARLDLARTLILAGQNDEALNMLAELVEQNPGNMADVARLAGDLSYQSERYDNAVKYYQVVTSGHQMSEHFPASAMGVLWSHHAAKNPQALIVAYRRLAEALPPQDQPGAAYLAAVAYQRLNQHAEAVELLSGITARYADAAIGDQLLYRLAISQSKTKQLRQMEQSLMRLLAAYPRTQLRPDAMFLLAQADAEQGNVARGVARLTEIIEQGNEHPYYLSSLLQRARLYEQNNRIAAAITDYNTYLENCEYQRLPQSADGRTLFKPTETQAKILLRLLDLSYGSQQYKQTQQIAAQWFLVMQLPPEIEQESLYRVALSHIKLDEHDQAIDVLTQLNQKHPVHRYEDEANYYLGLLRTTQGQPGEATVFLKEASISKTLDPALRANALRLLFFNYRDGGELPRAANALLDLEQVSGRSALSVEDLNWLGAFFVSQEQPKQAMPYLTEALLETRRASLSEQGQAHYWQGRALYQLNRLNEAKASFEQAIKAGRGPIQEANLWLGKTLLAMDQPMEAVGTLLPLSSDEKPSVAAAALLALGEASIGQADAALRVDDDQARANSLVQARRFLKRLVLLYASPNLSPMPERGFILLAQVEYQMNEKQQAEKTLDEFNEKYAYSTDYLRLSDAMRLQWQGQDARAAVILRTLIDETDEVWMKSMAEEQLRR